MESLFYCFIVGENNCIFAKKEKCILTNYFSQYLP